MQSFWIRFRGPALFGFIEHGFPGRVFLWLLELSNTLATCRQQCFKKTFVSYYTEFDHSSDFFREG